jgi:hypothetical protein
LMWKFYLPSRYPRPYHCPFHRTEHHYSHENLSPNILDLPLLTLSLFLLLGDGKYLDSSNS